MENQWIVGETVCDGRIARGELRLPLSGTERAGHCYTTERIETGLGPGIFDLHFFSVDRNGFDGGLLTEDRLVFGDPVVFSQSGYIPSVPAVSLGAYGDPADGSFCLGLMLHENARRGELVVGWWAEKPAEKAEEPAAELVAEEPAEFEPEPEAVAEPEPFVFVPEPVAEEPAEFVDEPAEEEPAEFVAEPEPEAEPVAESEPFVFVPEPVAEEPVEFVTEPVEEEPAEFVAEPVAEPEPFTFTPEPIAEEPAEFTPEPVAEEPAEFVPEPETEPEKTAPGMFVFPMPDWFKPEEQPAAAEPAAEPAYFAPEPAYTEPAAPEYTEPAAPAYTEPAAEPAYFTPEPAAESAYFTPEPAPEAAVSQAAPDLPDWFKAVIAELEAAEAEAKRAEAAQNETDRAESGEPAAEGPKPEAGDEDPTVRAASDTARDCSTENPVTEEPETAGSSRSQSILAWFNSDGNEAEPAETAGSDVTETEPEPAAEEPVSNEPAMPEWLRSMMVEIKGNDPDSLDFKPFRFKPLDEAQTEPEPETAPASEAAPAEDAAAEEPVPADEEPADFEPTEFRPTEFESTEYESTEYEPTDFEPMNFEPLNVDFSKKDLIGASTTRPDPTGITLVQFDIETPEMEPEKPARPVWKYDENGEKAAPVIAVPDPEDLKAATREEAARKEEARKAEEAILAEYAQKARVIELPDELKAPEDRKEPEEEPFFINLAPRTLAPGRSFPFSCVKPENAEIEWFVGPNGGEINEEGFYTAPMEPGVYMVGARIRGTDREVSQYVMVR